MRLSRSDGVVERRHGVGFWRWGMIVTHAQSKIRPQVVLVGDIIKKRPSYQASR
jgi:hypothetical protein